MALTLHKERKHTMKLLPTTLQPYAKAWVTLIGVIVTTVTTLITLPRWVTIIGAIATTLATYLTPNGPTTPTENPVIPLDRADPTGPVG